MDIESDAIGVALLWLAFMTVCGIWAVRIATLLLRQRLAERIFREQLASSLGALIRERRREEGIG